MRLLRCAALLLIACSPETARETRTCFPSAGATGAPVTVAEAVALLNVLPRPVTAACFVESLDRPLGLAATRSTTSAQPAAGSRSPRIFLFSGPLIISVVAEGAGAEVLEFSELDLATERSVKAELHVPITATLRPEDPFTGFNFGSGATSCSLCHAGEEVAYTAGTARAFSSAALRPTDESLVSLPSLQQQAEACDAAAEPERCALLDALFEHGDVRSQAFPEELPTFF